jgi:hypothetical protein|tara:strand:+ start:3461 stop:3919 length:459 start_codon:yes stop_codon:yes gene_type:complete
MKIDKDQLIEGPFGGNACYEQTFTNEGEEIKTWLCFGSGYSSSTLMKEGSKTLLNLIETSPELYKDLFFTDKNKYVWAPATISLPEKGMVFVDGKSKEDWNWSAAKATKIPDADLGKYPEGQTHKMDMPNAKSFKRNDFMDALEYIGFYAID